MIASPVEAVATKTSKRKAFADKTRRKIPVFAGRETSTLSTTEVVRIGKKMGVRK